MGNRLALLIGVSEYEPGFGALPCAVRDVEAMRRVLVHPQMGEFAPDQVTVLKNPLRQEMETAIYKLFADRQKDDLLLLYFSGHGVKDDRGDLYLASCETRKENGRLIDVTAVDGRMLHRRLNDSKSQHQVIVLDCCFSGAIAQGLTVKDDGKVDLQMQLGGKGRAILTSSTFTQLSFEQEESELSIYTRYLVEGIETGAADRDGDGWISVNELHEYAGEKVQEVAPAMTPKFFPVEEGYKIRLARAPIGDPRVIYRKAVAAIARESEGVISPIDQSYLDELRHNSGLSSTEAAAIAAEVLSPYRQRQEKLQRYEQVLREAIQRRYPLSEGDKRGLKRLQQALKLRDEDVTLIERCVPRPRKPPLTRRQFLRFVGFGGAGLGIAAVWQLLQEVGHFLRSTTSQPRIEPSSPSITVNPPITPKEISLRNFGFETVTVNAQGKTINRQSKQAQFFVEELGNEVTLEMVAIPAGEFLMGSPDKEAERGSDEGPQHTVKVPAFFMGKFEVTQAQWSAVAKLPKVKIDLKADPSKFKGAKRPVENVSWLEAVEFCDRLSQKTGRTYRLPSEAEWEYACRAGTKTPFHFGEIITTDLVNFGENYTYAYAAKGQYREQTTEVGSFPANAFGLYDMHGNVWEWCLDHWYENYKGAPTDGSAWIEKIAEISDPRVLRGGSWVGLPRHCRSASRDGNAAGSRGSIFGFRVVCLAPRTH